MHKAKTRFRIHRNAKLFLYVSSNSLKSLILSKNSISERLKEFVSAFATRRAWWSCPPFYSGKDVRNVLQLEKKIRIGTLEWNINMTQVHIRCIEQKDDLAIAKIIRENLRKYHLIFREQPIMIWNWII